jgi:YgiT-type zinc finger domain-containing protein
MKCMHCSGEMKRSTAPFHVDRHGYHLLLDTVPAWVCSQCGEAYFDEREVQAIQGAIKALDQQAAELVETG